MLAFGDRALESGGIYIAAPKDVERLPRLFDGALVGTAHNRQVTVSETVPLQRSGSGDSQRLKGFEGGSHKTGGLCVARDRENTPPVVCNRCLNMVPRFNNSFSQKTDFQFCSLCAFSPRHGGYYFFG
jgi:hypothetical protein